ncbi:MAG: DUF3276 family protein [Saprospiraceae bacterium]|nr:DUF3276 family protein [Saprospiraceae bacterium]
MDLFSKKIPAGSRRTYFMDVKQRDGGDIYLLFSESFTNRNGMEERSRIQINKEDLQKVADGLEETLNHIRKELKINFY